MSVALYFDEHVPSAIAEGLRRRGVDVLTVQEDLRIGGDDESVVDRATTLGRVVFSRDEDFLKVASRRLSAKRAFSGIIYAHQLRLSIGECINQIEVLVKAGDAADFANEVFHLRPAQSR